MCTNAHVTQAAVFAAKADAFQDARKQVIECTQAEPSSQVSVGAAARNGLILCIAHCTLWALFKTKQQVLATVVHPCNYLEILQAHYKV